jgi:hypothetical protein
VPPLAGTGQRYAYAHPVCRLPCEPSDGTHTTLSCCLAVPACRPRAGAPPGFHRSGVLAGLDVLLAAGTPGAIIALLGIAALTALIRRHTGMAFGAALPLIALVGLVGLVWVVFALVAGV